MLSHKKREPHTLGVRSWPALQISRAFGGTRQGARSSWDISAPGGQPQTLGVGWGCLFPLSGSRRSAWCINRVRVLGVGTDGDWDSSPGLWPFCEVIIL